MSCQSKQLPRHWEPTHANLQQKARLGLWMWSLCGWLAVHLRIVDDPVTAYLLMGCFGIRDNSVVCDGSVDQGLSFLTTIAGLG